MSTGIGCEEYTTEYLLRSRKSDLPFSTAIDSGLIVNHAGKSAIPSRRKLYCKSLKPVLVKVTDCWHTS